MSEADRGAFLEAIRADPADTTARLVFADWLDERGDPDGELIRLLCEVQAAGYADTRAWRRLKQLTDRLIVQIGRLCERDQRLFGCDCAERVLRLADEACSDDGRLRQAVQTARRHALGMATADELDAVRLAACEALGTTTSGVRGNAALAVAGATWTSAGCEGALAGAAFAEKFRCTACDGARDAIGYACGDAAWAAEARWQLCRAIEYRLGFVPPPTLEKE